MTYLAVSIKVVNPAAAAELIQRALRAAADMLELRLDYLEDPTTEAVRAVVTAARETSLPLIATCRADWEGGVFHGSEKGRKVLLKQAVRAGVDYIDIESACRPDGEIQIDELIGKSPVKVIRSSHDFAGVPNDLSDRIVRIKAQKADVGKIAYTAEKISDSFVALDWIHSQHTDGKEVIAMAMGAAGQLTRLLAKKLGAFLTFACPDDADATAAGQVSIAAVHDMYRWSAIDCDTKVYGVIGCPVGHSMSPALHNAALEAKGFNGLYLPLLVAPTWAEFRALLDGFRERKWLHVQGLSVTIPHKENALRYVESTGGELEDLARKIGAVNTLTIDPDGFVRGYNTDYAGALDAITAGAGIERADLKGVPTAVFGAGGVARALVAGLVDVGAVVTIINRTAEKAVLLAQEFGATARPLSELQCRDAKVVINCTSLGMHPKVDGTAVPGELLKSDMFVFDTVYNPLETRLLREAKAAGARTVDGVAMFVNQAAVQFELFTGLHPPREVMRQVVMKHLAK